MIYNKYGQYYDLIYNRKNYDGECKGLINYFERFAKGRVKSILDLGCGTGNHSIRLAEMGYEVMGVDQSEIMIEEARGKAERKNLPVEFFVQDMRKFDLKRKFDAILCLFGTFDYCTKDDEILAMLEGVRNHLKKKGLFIFDFWPVYTSAEESRRSVYEVEKGKTNIIRIIDSTFNLETCVRTLKIKCKIIRARKLIDSFQEEHEIRTFTPTEIMHFLKEVNLKPLGFFKIDWQAEIPYTLQKIDLKTTNVACIARK